MNTLPHRGREHSRYSASAAERWMNCPGSVRLCDGVPERKSSYAEEGTKAHELLESMLVHRQINAPGQLALRRAECPQDMIDAVQTAFDYVCEILDATPDFGLTIEKRFTLPSQAAPGEVFGTADVTIYDPGNKKLWVLDYKHGAGVPVEAVGSKQMRFYALGCMTQTPVRQIERVEMVIMQPRAFHPLGPIRSEEIAATELVDFFDEIETAITVAQMAEANYEAKHQEERWIFEYLRPSIKNCRWCPAATICPAREKQALALVGQDFADVRQVTADKLPDASGLPIDRIGQILAMKDIVVDWFDRVEKHAIEIAKAGTHIPERKLVEPIGRRSYDNPNEVPEKMWKATNLPASNWVEPTTPLGVTAMEKKIKELMKPLGAKPLKEALDAFALLTTKKSSGNLTLVAENDPRPAVNLAQSAFDSVVNIPQVQIEG